MQQGTTIEISSDADTCDRIHIQERLRQADMLAQISRTAEGIKSAFTICVTALCVLFVVGKVLPFAAKTSDAKRVISSAPAGANASKTQTLAAVNNEGFRSDWHSIR
jgi:hypothetical protein